MEKSMNSSMQRSQSSGALQATGQATLGGGSAGATRKKMPFVPRHLSVSSLTKRRKLPSSSGNLHGYMAEDYSQINFPLPTMFGKEKYAYSLIDVEVADRAASRDERYVAECGQMSKKLVRLQYDQQIIDLEWRKTYKLLLNAEHQEKVVLKQPASSEKTKQQMRSDVVRYMSYLLSLQEQKDMYQTQILTVSSRCDDIRTHLKQEFDLEELRNEMEQKAKESMPDYEAFKKLRFNVKSALFDPSAL